MAGDTCVVILAALMRIEQSRNIITNTLSCAKQSNINVNQSLCYAKLLRNQTEFVHHNQVGVESRLCSSPHPFHYSRLGFATEHSQDTNLRK
jgi:hypothetical protein